MLERRVGAYVVTIDPGHLAGVTTIVGLCVWYFFDARRVSDSFDNLLLIAPAAALAVVLYAVIVARDVRIRRADGGEDPAGAPADGAATAGPDWKQFALMGLLAAYVLAMPYAGFDVATAAFVFLALRLEAKQSWRFAALYALAFTVLTVGGLRELLSVPVPTLLDRIG